MKKLSMFELKCGGVQNETVDAGHLYYIRIELYMQHAAYHVRAFKHVVGSSSCDRIAWNVFDTLKEAQKNFKELKKLKLREV